MVQRAGRVLCVKTVDGVSGDGTCVCPSPYAGTVCQLCASGYTGVPPGCVAVPTVIEVHIGCFAWHRIVSGLSSNAMIPVGVLGRESFDVHSIVVSNFRFDAIDNPCFQ
jgi:hypothetical protein